MSAGVCFASVVPKKSRGASRGAGGIVWVEGRRCLKAGCIHIKPAVGVLGREMPVGATGGRSVALGAGGIRWYKGVENQCCLEAVCVQIKLVVGVLGVRCA